MLSASVSRLSKSASGQRLTVFPITMQRLFLRGIPLRVQQSPQTRAVLPSQTTSSVTVMSANLMPISRLVSASASSSNNGKDVPSHVSGSMSVAPIPEMSLLMGPLPYQSQQPPTPMFGMPTQNDTSRLICLLLSPSSEGFGRIMTSSNMLLRQNI